MRIRSIKPEYWRSDDITALPISTRLTFIGLWSYVDDNGVGADKIVSIVADLYADDFSRDPQETLKRVTADLVGLASGGQVVRYRAIHNERPKDLLYITRWKHHQVVNHPSKGHIYPEPPAEMVEAATQLTKPSRESLETLRHEQGNRGSEQGSRGTEEKDLAAPKAQPKPKTQPRKRIPGDYMPQQHNIEKVRREFPTVSKETLETVHEDFCLYWTGQGKPMADWDSTWLRWIRKELAKVVPLRNGAPISTADQRVAQTQALKLVVPDDRMELE